MLLCAMCWNARQVLFIPGGKLQRLPLAAGTEVSAHLQQSTVSQRSQFIARNTSVSLTFVVNLHESYTTVFCEETLVMYVTFTALLGILQHS